MKKVGLAAFGVAGACAACCAIPLALPILGTFSISGLSFLAVDRLLQGPTGIAIAIGAGVGAAIWTGLWYVGQRRKRWMPLEDGAACTVGNGAGGCSCPKEVS